MTAIRIARAEAPADIAAARELFRDYAAWLDRDHGINLEFQNIDTELATLPGRYAPPTGALLLGLDRDGAAIGCVAMRRLREGDCEIKRLFVRPAARGTGLGLALAERIMDEARRLGYRRAMLDTTSFMTEAQHIYERLGFRDVPAYYDNPYDVARYMGCDLQPRP